MITRLIGTSFILTILFPFTCRAWQENIFISYENTLKRIGVTILYGENDSVKYAASSQFTTLLLEALKLEGSYDYPFDSLKTIARLMPVDKKFRIFNWNLPKDDGTYEYFGIIQLNNTTGNNYKIIQLEDKSFDISTPETGIFTGDNWYGALYYKIIEKKYRQQTYYMLLGWDGNNRYTRKKIIEVLTFDTEQHPVFGAHIFKGNDYSQNTRIIFEYYAAAGMSLKYEKHGYNKVMKIGRHTFTRKAHSDMIVFDRLVPLDESYTGQSILMVPSGGINDAFIFRKGCWGFTGDVDARNPETKEKKRKKEVMEYDLFPAEK
jgi:hypothetical protein